MSGGPKAPTLGAEQLLANGEALHQAGDLRRAEHMYREALRLAPGHPRALGMLGVLGCQSGNIDGGIALLRDAHALAPDDADIANNLGQALLSRGDAAGAVPCFERALATRPRFAEAHFNYANALLAEQQGGAAEKHYRSALRLRPDYVDALNNLGNLLLDLGRADEAVQALHGVTRQAPDFARGHLQLARALLAAGRAEEGVAACRRAIALDEAQASAWELLAACQQRAGDLAGAAASLERAATLAPESAALHDRLSLVRHTLGRTADALAAFREAARLAPAQPLPVQHLGMALAANGDRAGAQAAYERALELAPTLGEALRELVEMATDAARLETLVAPLDAALAQEAEATRNRADLLFARGRLRDRRGEYAAAFADFTAANALRRAQVPYDRAAQRAFVAAVIETFSPDFLRRAAGVAHASERPVFVIGMPRAGTSLVEQILASHPAVHGAGELTFFPEQVPALTRRAGQASTFPRGIARRLDALAGLAPRYLELLAARDGAASRVTDKMPYNFLYLGVIGVLFPHARVIHVRRDAVATCHSIYTHDLTGSHPYSYDLESLAEAWLGYARLMQHWRALLPMPWLELDYETLVADQEGESRRLVDFLGLPWDDACLRFHQSGRPVATASQWQVRQPLYGEARAHWRHYASELAPLVAALEAGGWSRQAVRD